MMIETPIVIVNFKLYGEAAGENAVRLAEMAERASGRTGVTIAVAPNIADVKEVVKSVRTPVYAQHVDPVDLGAHTGHVSPRYLRGMGVEGTLLNHSERKLELSLIIDSLRVVDEVGLKSVLCAATPGEAVDVLDSGVRVSAVAIEPPELIGTGRAVSRYKPELIEGAAEVVKNYGVPLLCGAGIVTGEDVRKAAELGSEGILVASGVVKAPDPEKVMEDFALNL